MGIAANPILCFVSMNKFSGKYIIVFMWNFFHPKWCWDQVNVWKYTKFKHTLLEFRRTNRKFSAKQTIILQWNAFGQSGPQEQSIDQRTSAQFFLSRENELIWGKFEERDLLLRSIRNAFSKLAWSHSLLTRYTQN